MGKERGLAFSFTCLWKHFKKSKGPFFFLLPFKKYELFKLGEFGRG